MKKIAISCLISITIMLVIISPANADIRGIDVSRWQGTIDWDSAGTMTGFAIIKAGGSDDGLYTDSQFERNRDEARRLDIPRGYYYYTGGGDPILEAEHFAGIVGTLQPGEAVALDYEIDTGDPVAYSWLFLVRTEQLLGVKPLFYTNMNRVWAHDWKPVVDNGNHLWGAIYDESPAAAPPSGAWPGLAIKQFTNAGTVPGISGHSVDLNVLNNGIGDFRDLGMTATVPLVNQKQVSRDTAISNIPAAHIPDNAENETVVEARPATVENEVVLVKTYVNLDATDEENSNAGEYESGSNTDSGKRTGLLEKIIKFPLINIFSD